MLRVDPEQVDVRAFERRLERGREVFADREFDAAATVLRRALGLWRGAPLADFTFDAFAAGEIARLQELRLEALEIRIDADLALGRHAALIAELEALTTEYSLRSACAPRGCWPCIAADANLRRWRRIERRAGCWSMSWGWSPAPHCASCTTRSSDRTPRSSPSGALATACHRQRRPRSSAATSGGRHRRCWPCRRGGRRDRAARPQRRTAPGRQGFGQRGGGDRPVRNAVVGQIAVGVRPGDISAGAGGIGVANLDDNSVSQIDPRSASVKHGLSVGGAAIDALATSADAAR